MKTVFIAGWQIVEVYGIWYEGDNGKKVVEVREKFIPDTVNVDDIGYWMLFDGDYVNEIDSVMNWEVFSKPFEDRVKEAVDQSHLNKNQKSSVLLSVMKLEKWLWKFEYKERLEFIFDMIRTFYDTHNAGASKALDAVLDMFKREKITKIE